MLGWRTLVHLVLVCPTPWGGSTEGEWGHFKMDSGLCYLGNTTVARKVRVEFYPVCELERELYLDGGKCSLDLAGVLV